MQETILFGNTVKKGINISSRFEAGDIIINKNSNSIAKILEVEYPNVYNTHYTYLIEKQLENNKIVRIVAIENMLDNWSKVS